MYLENGKLIFDKENCDDCYHEALAWCDEDFCEKVLQQYDKKYNQVDFMNFDYSNHSKCIVAHPNERLCKDPARERLYKRRKGDKRTTGHKYRKESYSNTIKVKRKFRRTMKHRIYDEEFYKPRPRDYHTYGWMTW